MITFNCGCCSKNFPTIHMHVHHIIPQSAGGKDDQTNLITLCPGCHDALHKLAYKLLSKKFADTKVYDMVKVIFPDDQKAQKTCMTLANHVRDSVIISREKGIDEDQIVSMSTTLRRKHKEYVNIRCKELGISQESYLRQLVANDLSAKYGLNLKELAERPLKNK